MVGNAYMSNYFTNMSSVRNLRKAIGSYKQAKKLLTRQNPDLYFNLGTVHQF